VTYALRLREAAARVGHILCLGLDPDLQRLPWSLERWEAHLEALLDQVQPAAIKPNAAYFEVYGSAGWSWLERLIARQRGRCPIILDAKRGDIGPSSRAYARSAFETLGADAITVSPWMGRDSLAPFLEYAPERGAYALVRTSNPGTADLQQQVGPEGPLWQSLYRRLPDWCPDGLGAVVGATGPEDLQWICAQPEVPLLIPGVGAQGGEAGLVMGALRSREVGLHRVNVSSKILFACEDYPELEPLEASLKAFADYAQQLAL
jgi:orotidine-5'-phosphate decarboxylase